MIYNYYYLFLLIILFRKKTFCIFCSGEIISKYLDLMQQTLYLLNFFCRVKLICCNLYIMYLRVNSNEIWQQMCHVCQFHRSPNSLWIRCQLPTYNQFNPILPFHEVSNLNLTDLVQLVVSAGTSSPTYHFLHFALLNEAKRDEWPIWLEERLSCATNGEFGWHGRRTEAAQ